MNLDKYQEWTNEVAQYPKEQRAYPVLGLFDEWVEFMANPVISEAGDVAWYFAQTCEVFGYKLSVVAESKIPLLIDDFSYVDPTNIFGLLQGRIKKVLRDNREVLLYDVFAILTVLWQMFNLELKRNNLSLDEVLENNHSKLNDRKERNVIKGDGDNR